MTLLLVLVLAALLGSIPFGVLIAWGATGSDLRRVGSGNIGATNVLRASGPLPAALTLLLDAGKGVAAIAVARMLAPPGGTAPEGMGTELPAAYEWAAVAAVAGHVFSPWLGLRGGKGVATAVGALGAISPALAGLGLAVFLATVSASRIVSLSSLLAAGTVLLATALCSAGIVVPPSWGTPPGLGPVASIGTLIALRHAANIRRLVAGSEPRLGSGSRPGEDRR
jgi:glycerol-3-phosphate acyltransferase PlsY